MLRERRGTHFMGNRARDALFTRHVNTVCGSTHCHAARTCPATLCNAKQCILPFLNFPLRKDATCWDHQKDGLEGMLCKTPTLKKKPPKPTHLNGASLILSVGDSKELYPALRLHECPEPKPSFDARTVTDEKKHTTSHGLDAEREKSQVVSCWKSPTIKAADVNDYLCSCQNAHLADGGGCCVPWGSCHVPLDLDRIPLLAWPEAQLPVSMLK